MLLALLAGCGAPLRAPVAARAPRECWYLSRADEWMQLCVMTSAVDETGARERGRVIAAGARALDAPYVSVHREGAAGTQYEELRDAEGRRVLLLERCGPCGCGGCLREARLGDEPESAAPWINRGCPSVTLEGCSIER